MDAILVFGKLLVYSWLCPPIEILKLNCNASVRQNGFVGIGFAIRDYQGCLMTAGVDRFMGDVGVAYTETLAIRCGL